jgi:hypothetical protein
MDVQQADNVEEQRRAVWQRSQERQASAVLGRNTPLAEPPVFVPTYAPSRMDGPGGVAVLPHAQNGCAEERSGLLGFEGYHQRRKPLSPLSPLSPMSPTKSPSKNGRGQVPAWQRAAVDYQNRLQMTATLTGSPQQP